MIYLDKGDAFRNVNPDPNIICNYQVLPIVYNNVFIFTTDYQIISITRNFTFDIDTIYSHNKIHTHLCKTDNINNQIKSQLYNTHTSKIFLRFDNAIFELIKDKLQK